MALSVVFNQVLSMLLLLLLLPVLCDRTLHARGGGEEHRTGGTGRARPFALVSTRTVPYSTAVQQQAGGAAGTAGGGGGRLVIVTAKRAGRVECFVDDVVAGVVFLFTSAGLRLVTVIDVGGGSAPPLHHHYPIRSRPCIPLCPPTRVDT